MGRDVEGYKLLGATNLGTQWLVFHTCLDCRAVVVETDTAAHTGWHRDVREAILDSALRPRSHPSDRPLSHEDHLARTTHLD